MGNTFLEKPITDKRTNLYQNKQFRVSSCQMQGWRRFMEDSYIAYNQIPEFPDLAIFGVFDGHGGAQTAKFVANHFLQCFLKRKSLQQGNIGQALKQTFINVQLMMKMKPSIQELIRYKKETTGQAVTAKDLQSGATATVVVITKDKVICANAGDSRASFCKKQKCIALSYDHKPQNPIQKQRIQKTGVPIIQGRVNGLNLTRSIGDFSHKTVPGLAFNKQPVICMPDIIQIDRQQTDQFILIGCDGIWQRYGDDHVALTEEFRKAMAKKRVEKVKQQQIGKQVLTQFFDKNLNPNNGNPYGRDNMTALIIDFKK